VHHRDRLIFSSRAATGLRPRWSQPFALDWRFGDRLKVRVLCLYEEHGLSSEVVGEWSSGAGSLATFPLEGRLAAFGDVESMAFDWVERGGGGR
jgi:hypothetical protein